MKPSRYNIFIDANEYAFIYNTLTKSLLLVDDKVKHHLERNQLERINTMDVLKKCGIIVDNDVDELLVFRLNHKSAQYTTHLSSFLIFTTYACNLKCPYCYEGPADAEYRSQFMSPETTSRVIKFICSQTAQNKSQAVGIALYGGEPLLNMGCCETVLKNVSEWCTSNKIAFSASIMSNGTLFNERVYTRIGDYLSYIHITLDGSQKFHDKKRVKKDGSPTYFQILQNLKQLMNTKAHLSIRINIDEVNKTSVGEVLHDLEEIGLKGRPRLHIYFSEVIPQHSCIAFSLEPESSSYKKNLTQDLSRIKEMALRLGWGNHLAVDPDKDQPMSAGLSCGYVRHGTYSIDPEGDIYICPALAGNDMYRIGKIRNEVEWFPLYYTVQTWDPSMVTPCNTCELLPLCKGGCPVASLQGKKTCNSSEQLYEQLKAYVESQYSDKYRK
ncbi:MAG: SPASM domain-containing protein [Theionarchaea archaeon]|nr:SPASM domain-containing protein [Theionarchaea archaeon]